ncbi:MAG: hypothetical protein ACU0BB_11250 [Paracoccaceae bacterium]
MFAAICMLLGVAAVGSLVFEPITEDEQENLSDDNLESNDLTSEQQHELTPKAEAHPPSDDRLEFSQTDIEEAPAPLDDWTQIAELPIIEGDQAVSLLLPENVQGELHLIEADYEVGFLSDEGEATRYFEGTNIYFVPEGDEFPEKYKWSDKGNTLFNAVDFNDNPDDFGGIKLIARLDGGDYATVDTSGSLLFDNSTQIAKISSNLEIQNSMPLEVEQEFEQSEKVFSPENETMNAPDSTLQINEVVDLLERDLSTAPDPLDDWTQFDNLPIIEGGQTVILRFPEDVSGELLVVEANYEQGLDSNSSSESATQIFVGSNIYLVPDGQEFPEEYAWSEEGNSLFNSATFVDDSGDFSGIKLIARLDGGDFVISDDTGFEIFDNRLPLADIISDLKLVS